MLTAHQTYGGRIARVAVAFISALLFAFLASPVLAQFKQVERSVKVGKMDRSYHAFIPAKASSGQEMPVIFAFHPGFGTGKGLIDQIALHRVPGADDFIIVYPEGFRRSWNNGDCCGPAMRRNVDDVGFVSAVLEDLEQFGRISPSKNFAAGFSNGFSFAQEVACRLPDRFSAIAGGGGVKDTSKGCSAAKPTSIFVMHGLVDEFSPFAGGQSEISKAGVRPPVSTIENFWSRTNRCGGTRTVTRLGGISCKNYTGCSGGNDVTICPIAEMGHWWPGAKASRATERKLGPAREDLNGSGEVINFFRSKL